MVSPERMAGQELPGRHGWLADRDPRIRFIGIGAQKCASTWLHDVLAQHPEVCVPSGRKEVDFFSYHFDFGFQWYEDRFTAGDTRIAGEISPSYLHAPGIADRVASYNPDMRIILIVRDPVARAWSNHKHEVRIGHFRGDDLSFEAGLRNNPAYIEQGLYAKHLAAWLAVYPRRQVLVLRFDDVRKTPEQVAGQVCEFLGIGPLPAGVDLHGKSNESYLVRHGALESLKNSLRSGLRQVGLGRAWEWLGSTGLRSGYRKANRMAPEDAIGEPLAATLERLRATFAPDIAELERLTGLSFDGWRR